MKEFLDLVALHDKFILQLFNVDELLVIEVLDFLVFLFKDGYLVQTKAQLIDLLLVLGDLHKIFVDLKG